MARSESDQAVANQMYDKFRDELVTRDLSNTENYDRAIFTVSTAFLGVSIASIKFVVPLPSAESLWLLLGCWGLLLVSVTSSLLAYRVGGKAIQRKLVQARRYYKEADESAFSERNRHEEFNSTLNLMAGSGLVLAMLLLIIFVSINITS